jgi:hypothetical protein
MDIFHEDAPGAGLYHRVQEHHVLRLYEVDEVCAALERQGFEVDVLDDYGAMTASIPTMGWKVFRCRPRSRS